MSRIRTLTACALAWLGSCSLALALGVTNPAPIQQDPTRLDAGTVLCSNVEAVNATQAAGTCTITPPQGYYVYITYYDISMCGDGTASQSPIQLNYTTANLNGLTFQFSQISGSTITTNAWANLCDRRTGPGPTPIKSAAPGTAVVITPPAQTAHVTFNTTVFGYFAPL
ncbi:MAG: hypothetical protein WAU78_16495 [Roseiarcus sp.]